MCKWSQCRANSRCCRSVLKQKEKPTLIICKTIIGFGSPNKSGSHDCHGAPLGDEGIALTRKALGWEYAPFNSS